MTRAGELRASLTDPAAGWDARLWRTWIAYNALAYTLILAVVMLLTSLDLHVTRVAADDRFAGTLAIATAGAVLYGGVLGALQWRVLRRRVAMPRRRWVTASVLPALAVWAVFVVPAGVSAESSDESLRVAYFLAVSQALALGPVIGFIQGRALKPYTRRWKWWIVANLGSYLAVYGLFHALSLVIDAFAFADGRGTALEAFIVLLATTPLSGRVILWVTAEGSAASAEARRPDRPRGRGRTRPSARRNPGSAGE